MLDFIGQGSAFNTDLGCTAAYIRKGNTLLLIDCGGDVFGRLKAKGLLDGVENMMILITHTHSDHIGSLGTLIEYCQYILHIKPHVFAPENLFVSRILKLMGVLEQVYTENQSSKSFILNKDFPGGIFIQAQPTTHKDTIKCYGYLIAALSRVVYYSGDSNTLPKEMFAAFKERNIDIWYQDVCYSDYENNVHLFYGLLKDYVVDPDLRKYMILMHADESFTKEKYTEVVGDGFIPSVINRD